MIEGRISPSPSVHLRHAARRASLDMSLAAGGASGRSEMHFTRNTDFAAQLAIRTATRRDIGDVVYSGCYGGVAT